MLATGTALNLGTGSSSDGRYQKTGNTYSGWASFTFGTTGVVAGTGTYTFSLPSASAADGTNKVVGTAYLVDSSAGTLRRVGAVLLSSGAANVTIVVDGETSAVNPGGPWAWAASDIIRLSFAYEGA